MDDLNILPRRWGKTTPKPGAIVASTDAETGVGSCGGVREDSANQPHSMGGDTQEEQKEEHTGTHTHTHTHAHTHTHTRTHAHTHTRTHAHTHTRTHAHTHTHAKCCNYPLVTYFFNQKVPEAE